MFQTPKKVFFFTERKKEREKEEWGWWAGEQKKGVRRSKQAENTFCQAGGLLRLEVSVTSVFINNAIHIRASSRPYTFFSNLRHGGSSPWVCTHFQWQQGRRAHVSRLNSQLTLPAAWWHLSFPWIILLTVLQAWSDWSQRHNVRHYVPTADSNKYTCDTDTQSFNNLYVSFCPLSPSANAFHVNYWASYLWAT